MPRVTITVPDHTPQPYRFQLDRRVVSLGRGSENDIAIDSSSVSVKHAEMVRTEAGFEIRDLGSTNGTKLDGERRMVIPLQSGLVVQLGDVAFEFQLSEEELAALEAEAPRQLEAEEPRAVPKPKRQPSMASASASSGGGGFFMFVLFVVLGTAAFFVGMSIRHQKDTGNNLLKDMQKARVKVVPAPETPATETPAEPAAK